MKIWTILLVLAGTVCAQVPQSKHVWIVTEENHSYESIIGNPEMPYYNSLAQTYGLATQYYSPRHNSLSALMWLVAGQTVTTNNNTTHCFDTDNIVRQLLKKGLTWKSYQRDLPYAGFEGIASSDYVRRHNPLIDFTDACTSEQKVNSVPFTQLHEDIADRTTPNFAYITPDLDEDAHDGTLAEADQWLRSELPAILSLPEFKPGGDGLMFIVWDEGNLSNDNRCSSRLTSGCGGRVATLVIGPQVRPQFQSQKIYTHSNLLRTVCDALQLASCPGEGAVASPMDDFFNRVNITAPFDDAVVTSPVHIHGTTENSSSVMAMSVYVDNILKYQTKTSTIDISLPLLSGAHNIVIQSWDANGGIQKNAINVKVQSAAVVVSSPIPGSIVSTPVLLNANAKGPSTIRDMTVSIDGSAQQVVKGSSINTSLPISSGVHILQVKSTDEAGTTKINKFNLTVAKPSITVLSPAEGASLYSPLQLDVLTQDPNRVHAIKVYVDDVLFREFSGLGLKSPLSVPIPGKHRVVFQVWNKAGGIYQSTLDINVRGVDVKITEPVSGAYIQSPVHVHSSVPGDSPIYSMQVYVDGKLAYKTNGKTIDTSLAMSSGTHHIVAKAWDDGGGTWTSEVDLIVK